MYLVLVTLGLCVAYVGLLFLFPMFFEQTRASVTKKSFHSIAIIVLGSLAGYAVALSIPNLEIGNRVLHGFGGGFMGFLVCYLAAKDSGLQVNRVQFFLLSALVVTALGVGNELLELFLHYVVGFVFAKSPNDTGLDLLSNTVGILIAAACLVPRIGKKDS